MRNSESIEPGRLDALKALASPVRLAVLEYLKDPTGNFPPQVDGDPVTDGICADFLRDKLGIAPATASRHLTLLVDCGLLIATRKKGWTFYRRDEGAIARFTAALAASL
ncbi:MAG: winged helix-turn-helix domain-containing protein [Sphingomonas sp.]|jgi:ArsR family transcriptional regulator|uniref:ArsR/SmtB family transcription factor n=1 Tax=Sphingomonas sp. TaxID=28214 RepID=UPI003567FDC5